MKMDDTFFRKSSIGCAPVIPKYHPKNLGLRQNLWVFWDRIGDWMNGCKPATSSCHWCESRAADASRFKNRDKLYEQAIGIAIREGRGSVSLLQRSLGIGYGRAACLLDSMAAAGIVGQYNDGLQAREILRTLEPWAQLSGAADTLPGTGGDP